MKKYQVKYQNNGSSAVQITTITASSASQAKEKLKAQKNGKVTIISCVEQ